ncbi:Pleiotropic drug resistance ABC transporter protein [Mycena kentingensis (nom. inval.)]|nr:Pleiotropic drug resistance ABC transporter protein [Mycena kentingensis (nom. inval.)]
MNSSLEASPSSQPRTVASSESLEGPLHILPNASNFTIDGGHFTNVNGGMHIVQNRPEQPSSRRVRDRDSEAAPDRVYADSELYSKNLLVFKRGFPLLIARPRSNLPREYRQNGVSIGDVGRISPEGDFDFFFNVFRDATDPINLDRVPEGFHPMAQFKEKDILAHELEAGSIASPSVQPHCPAPNAIEFELKFTCCSPNGALLALPHGSKLRKLENVEAMRTYAAANAEAWYRYANGERGRRLVNGGLYLITGWEKAETGGMATFQNVAPGRDFEIALQPRPYPEGALKYSFSRSGPAHTQTFATSPPAENAPNNTVFLHGFSMSLGRGIIQRLIGKRVMLSQMGENPDSSGPDEYIPFSDSDGSFLSLALNFFSGGSSSGGNQASMAATEVSEISQSPEILHPSRWINAHLGRKIPDASVIITHDDDWAEVLEGNSDALFAPDFIDKVMYHSDIRQEDGTVYLQAKPYEPEHSVVDVGDSDVDIPPDYIERLHMLAPQLWNRSEIADCSIVVVPERPGNLCRVFPAESPEGLVALQTKQGVVHQANSKYLFAASTLLRRLLSEPENHDSPLPPFSPVSPPSPPSRVILLPVPDRSSFPHLLRYMYFGDREPIEAALNNSSIGWDGVARNAEYLGVDENLRMFLAQWQAKPGAKLPQQENQVPPDSKGSVSPVRRSYMACKDCRARKTKCTTSTSGPPEPCMRCVSKGLRCEYLAVEHAPWYPSSPGSKADFRSLDRAGGSSYKTIAAHHSVSGSSIGYHRVQAYTQSVCQCPIVGPCFCGRRL